MTASVQDPAALSRLVAIIAPALARVAARQKADAAQLAIREKQRTGTVAAPL